MIPRRIALVLFLIIASSFVYADHDGELSLLYAQEADRFYRNAQFNLALTCVHRALEFKDNNSNALYLKGIISYELGEPIGKTVGFLDKALSSGTWSIYGAVDARKAAFRLCMEAGKPDEALEYINSNLLGLTEDNELYYLYSIALERTGRIDEAKELVRFASDKFEEDSRFIRMLIRLDDSVREEVAASVIEENGGGYKLSYIGEALLYHDTPAVRQILSRYYLEWGGDDIRVKIESIRFDPTVTPETLQDLVRDGLFENSDYLARVSQYLQTTTEKDELRNLFNSFSGTMVIGKDRGYTVRTRYRDGIPWQITADTRWLDRIIEVGFSVKGEPEYLRVTEEDTRYTYTYGTYPYLDSLEIVGTDEKLLYIMEKGVVLDVLEDIIHGYPVYSLSFHTIDGGGEEYIIYASRIITMGADEYISDRSEVTPEGVGILRESMRDIMDRMIVLQDGQPVRGTADSDQDGRYETTLQYEDGRVLRVLYDGNDNSIPEYIYYPGDIAREEWDFDEDGRIDTREYSKNGIQYLEYDDTGDGNFIRYSLENGVWRELE